MARTVGVGKQARAKRARRTKRGPQEDEQDYGAGDLRLVDRLTTDFIAGIQEAETALRMMGRDATHPVARIGEEKGHSGLVDLAKQLVALRPQVETNLYPLRRASVEALVTKHANAPLATDLPVPIAWHSVAIFDPIVIAEDLSKTGKPRLDMSRLGSGDLAWFSLAPDESANIRFTTTPATDVESSLKLFLRVQSGIVFVGPPEASDGSRLGEVRIDPFRTRLDEHVGNGAFLRVKPGDYTLAIRRPMPNQVEIRLLPAADDRIPPTLEGLIIP